MSTQKKLAGLAIAAAAAALLVSGVVTAAEQGSGVKIKCYGANSRKGHGECKIAMNACKGKGFEKMTESACIETLSRA